MIAIPILYISTYTGPSHGPKYWEGGLLIKVKIIGGAALLKSSDGEKPGVFQSPGFGLSPGFEINYPGFSGLCRSY